jgi:hypothetical protein
MGGHADAVLRRTAAMADGWFPQVAPDDNARRALDRLRDYAVGAGRDPAEIGVEPRVGIRHGEPPTWPKFVAGWRELGATHLGINTMDLGLRGREHIEAIERLHRELAE